MSTHSNLKADATCESEINSQSKSKDKKHCRFYGCYLLASISSNPRSFNRTYIGFTVDPVRRLRQHNGLINNGGAHRTKRHRPWRLIAVIHGFSCQTQGLQFEWAWQNPFKSVSLRLHGQSEQALPVPKSRRTSVLGCLTSLAALTSVPPWSTCPLTLTVCSERSTWETYGIQTVVFPQHLRVQFTSFDTLSIYKKEYSYKQACDTTNPNMNQNVCMECNEPIAGIQRLTYCSSCGTILHLKCAAKWKVNNSCQQTDDAADATQARLVIPDKIRCKQCNHDMHWSLVVRLSRVLDKENIISLDGKS